ncbi:hypothetical protein BDV06DRAFT_214225 [Aspergillus oleicola]
MIPRILRRGYGTMSSKPGLLLIGRLQHCQPEWNALGTKQQFIMNCQSGTFDGVVGLYRINSIAETRNFNQSLVSQLPSTLKFIGYNGAKYHNIDNQACTARGIPISNTPKTVANATADVAMFLVLGTLRYGTIPLEADRNNELSEARKYLTIEGDAKYVTMDELLQQSDIVSLNLLLTAATDHLISGPEINKMKDRAIIINTARGPSRRGGFVLVKNRKIMLLPHLGTTTVETKREMELLAIRIFRVRWTKESC